MCCCEETEGDADDCEAHVSDNDTGTDNIRKISDTELHISPLIGMHFIVKEERNVYPFLFPGPLLHGKVISITYSECVCSHWYPACNAYVPFCHLWPVRLYNIFPHYLINGTIS